MAGVVDRSSDEPARTVPGAAVRASDAERDEVAERLRVAYGEGRLTGEEFTARLDTVLAARTRGELAGPVADLPAPPSRPLAPGAAVDRTGRPGLVATRTDHPLAPQWAVWGVASAVCLVLWLVGLLTAGGADGAWPVWVVLPWGLVLLARTVGGRTVSQRRSVTGAPERRPGIRGTRR